MKNIFIVGCPRSGTTLLQKLLLNIPNSFSMPETDFFNLLLSKKKYLSSRSLPPLVKYNYPDYITKKVYKRIKNNFEKINIKPLDEDLDAIFRDLIKKNELKVSDFFNRMFSFYAKGKVEYAIEKTPTHIFHIEYIKEKFPEAIIINIVRDPRDTFASFKKFIKLQEKPQRPISEFIYIWKKSIEYAKKNNLDCVRYEDLIRDSENVISDLLRKYNITIKEFKNSTKQKIILDKEIWKANVEKNVLTNNKYKYRKKIAQSEICLISTMCRREIKQYKYPKENSFNKYIFLIIFDMLQWVIVKNRIIVSKYVNKLRNPNM